MFGGGLSLLICAPAVLTTRRARNVLLASAVVGGAGTLVMVLAQAKLATGTVWSVSSWRAVFASSSGRWWFARIPVMILGAALTALRRHAVRDWWRVVGLVVTAGGVAVYAAGGHAMSGRWQGAGFIATMGHLIAMSVWSGGLFVLVAAVPLRHFTVTAGRFSPIALVMVVVLAVTGIVNAVRQLAGLSRLVDTTYGRWLVIKLIVVAAVLVAAGTSRWSVRKSAPARARPLHAVHHDTSSFGALKESPPVRSALRRAVAVEVIGVGLVLAVTVGLVNASPPSSSSIAAASVSVVEGERIAQVVLDPPITGGTTMHVYISSASGQLDRPDEITVEARLAAQQLGPLAIPMVAAGPDHVTTSSANLPIAGTWTFTITARYGEFDQVVFNADLAVR